MKRRGIGANGEQSFLPPFPALPSARKLSSGGGVSRKKETRKQAAHNSKGGNKLHLALPVSRLQALGGNPPAGLTLQRGAETTKPHRTRTRPLPQGGRRKGTAKGAASFPAAGVSWPRRQAGPSRLFPLEAKTRQRRRLG